MNPSTFPCATCKITCHIFSEFIKHIGSKEHAVALLIPVNPTIFPYNNLSSTTSAFQTFPEFITHTKSKDHVAACSGPVNVAAYPCTTCAIIFQTLPEFIAHIGSKDHALVILRENNSYSNIENYASTSSMSYKTDLLMNKSKAAPSWLTSCETCGKKFSNPNSYQQHIDSFGHKKKCGLLSPVQIPDKALLATFYSLSCKPCGAIFSGPIPYQDHIRSMKHKKKVSASNSSSSEEIVAASKPKDLKCKICDETLIELSLYAQHLNSSAHKEAVLKKYLNKFTGGENNFKSDGELSQQTSCLVPSLEYYCDMCEVHCINIDSFRAHLNGKFHLKKMIRKGADSNQSSRQSLLSGQASLFESSAQTFNLVSTEIDGRSINGYAATGDMWTEVNKSLYGEDWNPKTITPSNIDFFFGIPETIDFSQNSMTKIEARDVDMIDINEEENEEMDVE